MTTGNRIGTSAQIDLRTQLDEDVLARVEHALDVQLDRGKQVRKRRSVGTPTDRGTWVRIEVRRREKITGQGFNGAEAAAVLTGIAMPAWHAGMSWNDPERGVMWRADETDLITAASIKPGGILTNDPQLTPQWWAGLNDSLDSLARAETTRVATLHTVAITQERVSGEIGKVFGADLDTTVHSWVAAHADFAWPNLTAPEFWILDWEDWGQAPRGLDAAMLWSNSLAVPGLAEQVRRVRQADLDSRDGQLMMLFFAAGILGAPADYSGPLLEPARRVASELIPLLRS
ncbi:MULTISPECIES: hypothetical protein [unclassified Crossiella]|uniref:hypothetical protein n=1 Tax=unclassified Crossiella TaxID=2620835 RepID=UPI001FFE5DEF|nr:MULTISPECIES: hypothetical protein [unclassified Crossiella]MCK2245191.1 hypothetical protein [Crossiella sp. S99.2]MCK2258887.1 hypothetical protein [Crossiella sp. S99.1]